MIGRARSHVMEGSNISPKIHNAYIQDGGLFGNVYHSGVVLQEVAAIV
jgi:hypothetical protein